LECGRLLLLCYCRCCFVTCCVVSAAATTFICWFFRILFPPAPCVRLFLCVGATTNFVFIVLTNVSNPCQTNFVLINNKITASLHAVGGGGGAISFHFAENKSNQITQQ
jgi:hypothetical protein